MRCKRRSRKHDFGKNVLIPKLYTLIYLSLSSTIKTYIYIFFNKNCRLNLFYPIMLLLLFVWMLFSLFPQNRRICMIASSTYELVLKCPECVNLHREFNKYPFWDRPYLMCTSTICLAFQIIVLRILRRWFQVTSNIPSQGHRHCNSTNNRRPEERFFSWSCQNSLLINPDKTKLLLIGTRQMLQNVPAYLETCYPTTTTSCAKKKISDNFFNT